MAISNTQDKYNGVTKDWVACPSSGITLSDMVTEQNMRKLSICAGLKHDKEVPNHAVGVTLHPCSKQRDRQTEQKSQTSHPGRLHQCLEANQAGGLSRREAVAVFAEPSLPQSRLYQAQNTCLWGAAACCGLSEEN